MRHPFISVIQDLWSFVITEVKFWLPSPKQNKLLLGKQSTPLLLKPSCKLLDSNNILIEKNAVSNNKITIPSDNGHVVIKPCSKSLTANTNDINNKDIGCASERHGPIVMYVYTKKAVCFVKPERDFDSVIGRFSYGTAVMVMGYSGVYAKVFWSHHEGWMHKDNLTPYKAEAWPHFVENKIYESNSDALKKLRLLTQDIFYAGELDLPLQSSEWVTYRLREQNRFIPWPVGHGRVPGDWQILLKGVPGIHIGIVPKTDSIMEWRGEDGIGRVAYVEKVASDQAVTISIAGYEVPGCFEEKIFLEADWRELRPVFIEVY